MTREALHQLIDVLSDEEIAAVEKLLAQLSHDAVPLSPVPDEASSSPPRRRLGGLWKDIQLDLTAEDFAQLRREAWAGLGKEPL